MRRASTPKRAGFYFALNGELALLGGLDMLAPTILILLFHTDSIVSANPPRRASPLDCVYMGNFQPS